MRLALANILHDRVRMLVTILGIAFAVFLMIFQGSLLCGFLRAATKLISATESDLWITARGVACFDFAAPFSQRLADVSQGIPGVKHTSRIAAAVAGYRRADGRHQLVEIVGADRDVGRGFPVPRPEPYGVLIDRSSMDVLGASPGGEVIINQRRARVLGNVDGFSSFLGSPYVFTSYEDAARYIGLRSEEAMYVLVRVNEGYRPSEVQNMLRQRLPEVDVLTRAEFERRSQIYWVSQTGAGGGILAAAVLGFVIGVMIVSQTIYATTMENIEEFATLKALGASRWFVVKLVLTQALICGTAGCALGIAVTVPAIQAARGAIAWIFTPWWLRATMIAPVLVMCCLAAIVSIRAALSVEPAKVFRA